jgi:hypothetical protein
LNLFGAIAALSPIMAAEAQALEEECRRHAAKRRGEPDIGLQWADARLAERRITVSDRVRRLKNVASNRDVPIPPIVRLQKLLGHASPHMTLRYMKHAPESDFQEDVAKVAASLSGERNREADAQAVLARTGLKPA